MPLSASARVDAISPEKFRPEVLGQIQETDEEFSREPAVSSPSPRSTSVGVTARLKLGESIWLQIPEFSEPVHIAFVGSAESSVHGAQVIFLIETSPRILINRYSFWMQKLEKIKTADGLWNEAALEREAGRHKAEPLLLSVGLGNRVVLFDAFTKREFTLQASDEDYAQVDGRTLALSLDFSGLARMSRGETYDRLKLPISETLVSLPSHLNSDIQMAYRGVKQDSKWGPQGRLQFQVPSNIVLSYVNIWNRMRQELMVGDAWDPAKLEARRRPHATTLNREIGVGKAFVFFNLDTQQEFYLRFAGPVDPESAGSPGYFLIPQEVTGSSLGRVDEIRKELARLNVQLLDLSRKRIALIAQIREAASEKKRAAELERARAKLAVQVEAVNNHIRVLRTRLALLEGPETSGRSLGENRAELETVGLEREQYRDLDHALDQIEAALDDIREEYVKNPKNPASLASGDLEINARVLAQNFDIIYRLLERIRGDVNIQKFLETERVATENGLEYWHLVVEKALWSGVSWDPETLGQVSEDALITYCLENKTIAGQLRELLSHYRVVPAPSKNKIIVETIEDFALESDVADTPGAVRDIHDPVTAFLGEPNYAVYPVGRMTLKEMYPYYSLRREVALHSIWLNEAGSKPGRDLYGLESARLSELLKDLDPAHQSAVLAVAIVDLDQKIGELESKRLARFFARWPSMPLAKGEPAGLVKKEFKTGSGGSIIWYIQDAGPQVLVSEVIDGKTQKHYFKGPEAQRIREALAAGHSLGDAAKVEAVMENIVLSDEPAYSLVPASEIERLAARSSGMDMTRQWKIVLGNSHNQVIVIWDRDIPSGERAKWLESKGLGRILKFKNFQYRPLKKDLEGRSLEAQVAEITSLLIAKQIQPAAIGLMKPQGADFKTTINSLKTDSSQALFLLHYLIQINGNLSQDVLRIFAQDPKTGDFIATLSEYLEGLFQTYQAAAATQKAA